MANDPIDQNEPVTENNAPEIQVSNQGGEPHGVTQHREIFGTEVAPIFTDSLYTQVPEDVDLDKVVEPADLSSGVGHRIQVQGVDAPPPAVISFGAAGFPDYVNGVQPTQAQQDLERANHVDVNGRPIVDVLAERAAEERQQAKQQRASNRGR